MGMSSVVMGQIVPVVFGKGVGGADDQFNAILREVWRVGFSSLRSHTLSTGRCPHFLRGQIAGRRRT